MDFEQLLDRLWGFDAEIFAHDSLFVFISYRSGERVVFHNCEPNKIQEFIDKYNPILIGYNCNHYDKWILKCWLAGYNPEELKDVNDYIIGGGNGWDIDCGYVEVPTMWDLFNEINPRKSLKEIEGNLRLDITETTVPFDLPTKWTDEQYEEVVFYCTADVNALFPLFDLSVITSARIAILMFPLNLNPSLKPFASTCSNFLITSLYLSPTLFVLPEG